MKRLHLIELEDQPWFPSIIRDGGTDFLGFVFNKFKLYQPVIPLIKAALQKSGQTEIVDLCSGNGGPLESIHDSMQEVTRELTSLAAIRFTLSDKFPNRDAYRIIKQRTFSRIDFVDFPVDILLDTIERPGLRTMFSAVHHFQPDEVKTIIKKVIASKMPLTFFDGGSKSWLMILLIIIGHPILFFFCTPFIRPFKFSRLFFTYLLPLIPLYTMWDGAVSIFRLHIPEELNDFALAADGTNQYDWQHGKVSNRLGIQISYLIGTPK